jgi:hypothetical protein
MNVTDIIAHDAELRSMALDSVLYQLTTTILESVRLSTSSAFLSLPYYVNLCRVDGNHSHIHLPSPQE